MKSIERLTVGLVELGFSPNADQINALFHYLELMLAYNKQVNLTAITTMADAIDLHLLDSLTLKPWLDKLPAEAHLLDIGCGAGLPSIPIAIMYPQLKMTLLDARNKKVEACQSFISALNLKAVSAQHARIEQWHSSLTYDLLLCRAVSKCNQMLTWVKHLQYKQLLCMKGQHPCEELANLDPSAYTITKVSIPQRDVQRHIVVF